MYTIKLTYESFISKGASIFEISLDFLSSYVRVRRINCNWKAQSEKGFMHETFLRFNLF